MLKILVAAMLALAGSAWGQTWSTSQFTVSTDNLTLVTISGGTVNAVWVPFAVSNPASGSSFPTTFFDLAFAAQPGYRLVGERIDFGVDIDVDAYTAPTDLFVAPVGSFEFAIGTAYSLGATESGVVQHYSGTYVLHDANLVAQIDETVSEGIACPAGHDDNGCNDGLDWVWLQSLVEMTSFSVTPILTPVPEPDSAALLAAALGSLAFAAAVVRRRSARPAAPD